MKAKLLSISAVLAVIVFVACKKENAGPKIGLEFKDVNATSFAKNTLVEFRFKFTPKTDKALHTLFIARKFTTCPFIVTDTTSFNVPTFENTGNGELRYSFTYGQQGFLGCVNANGQNLKDSVAYSFWVKDTDGNISDTVRTPKLEFQKL
jgi:hypothetical protein